MADPISIALSIAAATEGAIFGAIVARRLPPVIDSLMAWAKQVYKEKARSQLALVVVGLLVLLVIAILVVEGLAGNIPTIGLLGGSVIVALILLLFTLYGMYLQIGLSHQTLTNEAKQIALLESIDESIREVQKSKAKEESPEPEGEDD